MTSAELLAELREVLADEIPTYGFSDVRALAYLNEGQEKFCEDTGFFSDIDTFTVNTEVGKASYALDERIIRVEDVFIGDRQLTKRSTRAAGSAVEPYYWSSALNSKKLDISPTPTSVVTMQLHTWRYPLAEMVLAGDQANPAVEAVDPEIPKRMHRACIEWAAYKCYGHHDVELQDSKAALTHRAAYRQYVLEGRALKRNMDAEQITVGTNPCYQV